MSAKVLPRPTAVSEPYWEGCAAGELRLQFCDACDRYQFYPRVMCTQCDQGPLDWRTVSGHGQIASFTVVRRGVSAAYVAPYVVALIDLDEGPRMMSQVEIDDVDDAGLKIGAKVQVKFEAWSEDVTMPVFHLR